MTRRMGRRRIHIAFWRLVNLPTRPLAGILPWWVLLETTGRRSRHPHRVPLATGPYEPDGMWLVAVHGRHAAWVRNLEAQPAVRMRVGGRWRAGSATVHPFDPQIVTRFNRYARGGPALMGMDPLLVRVDWT